MKSSHDDLAAPLAERASPQCDPRLRAVADIAPSGLERLELQYLPQWCAWWITRPQGVTVRRLYGPFNETEARLAAALYGAVCRNLTAGTGEEVTL